MVKTKATSLKPKAEKAKAGSIWKSLGISKSRGIELQQLIGETVHRIAETSVGKGISTTDVIIIFWNAVEGMTTTERTAFVHLGSNMLNDMQNPITTMLQMIRRK